MGKENNIAYLYMCHNNPDQLRRLAKILEYNKDMIFVHVDKKVDKKPFLEATKNCSNVHFVEDRIKNYWGGFNSVIATVKLMKSALDFGDFSRFVFLQGADYPLFSPKEIHLALDNSNVEYCKAKDITNTKHKGHYMIWGGYWCMDCNKNNFFIKCFRFILSRINKLGIKYRPGIFNYNGEKWHIFKGGAPFSITGECAKHIVNIYDGNKKFNKFMKHKWAPDELYFHTIIHNSYFKDNVSKNVIKRRDGSETLLSITYFEYPKEAVIFTKAEDYYWLKNTGCLFVRKVNETSKELLDEIDKNIKA
ncbi:MAG: hypothetical protein J6R29_06055 [Clostridia bacterium]|nr:hypothetical protein [Clostridia bacterium]